MPPRVVTNDDLDAAMETSDEWIVERTGIEERRWVEPGEGGAELARQGGERGDRAAGLDRRGHRPDHLRDAVAGLNFPGTACSCSARSASSEIPCLDIRQQCTGFIYGLSIADAYIRTGMYKNVLVIGAEVHSTGLDVSTAGRDVTVLFGDGAGAVVVGRATDDAARDPVDAPPRRRQRGRDPVDRVPGEPHAPAHHRRGDGRSGKHYPKMNGKKVFKHAVTRMPEAIMEGMLANGSSSSDIDMLIPHQANLRINEMVAQDDRPARREDAQQHPEVRQHDGRLDSDLHARGDRARQDQAGRPRLPRRVRRRPHVGLASSCATEGSR